MSKQSLLKEFEQAIATAKESLPTMSQGFMNTQSCQEARELHMFRAGRALGRREHPTWPYEQNCALCGTPMFSDEPMPEGEVHGTCAIARRVGRREMKGEAKTVIAKHGLIDNEVVGNIYRAIEAIPEKL